MLKKLTIFLFFISCGSLKMKQMKEYEKLNSKLDLYYNTSKKVKLKDYKELKSILCAIEKNNYLDENYYDIFNFFTKDIKHDKYIPDVIITNIKNFTAYKANCRHYELNWLKTTPSDWTLKTCMDKNIYKTIFESARADLHFESLSSTIELAVYNNDYDLLTKYEKAIELLNPEFEIAKIDFKMIDYLLLVVSEFSQYLEEYIKNCDLYSFLSKGYHYHRIAKFLHDNYWELFKISVEKDDFQSYQESFYFQAESPYVHLCNPTDIREFPEIEQIIENKNITFLIKLLDYFDLDNCDYSKYIYEDENFVNRFDIIDNKDNDKEKLFFYYRLLRDEEHNIRNKQTLIYRGDIFYQSYVEKSLSEAEEKENKDIYNNMFSKIKYCISKYYARGYDNSYSYTMKYLSDEWIDEDLNCNLLEYDQLNKLQELIKGFFKEIDNCEILPENFQYLNAISEIEDSKTRLDYANMIRGEYELLEILKKKYFNINTHTYSNEEDIDNESNESYEVSNDNNSKRDYEEYETDQENNNLYETNKDIDSESNNSYNNSDYNSNKSYNQSNSNKNDNSIKNNEIYYQLALKLWDKEIVEYMFGIKK